jgi:hypothetical protein
LLHEKTTTPTQRNAVDVFEDMFLYSAMV